MGRCVLVYLDDILVFSKTAEEHAELLRDHSLCAKRSKCQFNTTQLDFLGHVVRADGIKVDLKQIAVVCNWRVPKNVHDVRSFLDSTNYFRHFVQDYANMVGTPTNLLPKPVFFTGAANARKPLMVSSLH